MSYINKIDDISYQNIVSVKDIGFNKPTEKGIIGLCTKDGKEYERKSQTEDPIVVLELGQTYRMAGYDWTCAEKINGGYALQSQGIGACQWTLFNDISSSQDGKATILLASRWQILYSNIQKAENLEVMYGKGLYLVSNSKCNSTSNGQLGSGYYWNALKIAASKYRTFGADYASAWLGNIRAVEYPWCVNENGYLASMKYSAMLIFAPAFNLDASKVKLVDNEIIIK